MILNVISLTDAYEEQVMVEVNNSKGNGITLLHELCSSERKNSNEIRQPHRTADFVTLSNI
ncbi:hypothetical protein [Brevibacillus laterosporus]|uniref:hypothetical protein n=1 Tax=Brevibacillus laterosporus TaxID=1465 RepID=UPI003D22BCCC